METVNITKANAIKAYRKGTDSEKKMLSELLNGQVNFNEKITDRIKTFQDACSETSEDPSDPKFYNGTPDEIAYRKLKVITKALNEGVVLSWANQDQPKWRPYFDYHASGFRFLGSSYGCTDARAGGGSRLCFATEELATYAGKQFLSLYDDLHNK